MADDPRKPRPGKNRAGKSGPGKSRRGNSGSDRSRPDKSRPGKSGGDKSRPDKNRRERGSEKEPTARHNYSEEEAIRLNKYIAHSGFCSRRDADDYIAAGKVKVNGEVVTEMGVKVSPSDSVTVDGQQMSLESFVYILLNKPRDTITTTDDPRGRDTVMDQIEEATGKRVYPVGRLDRHTMGLLLLTNDGDLAHRLMHPSYSVRKTYEVESERKLRADELKEMSKGVELEDGMARPHSITGTPNGFIISVFEGRNRLVRRLVEHFGTEVTKLKRIEYGGLTLKEVKMGRWRYLRQEEVNALRKMVKLESLTFNKK